MDQKEDMQSLSRTLSYFQIIGLLTWTITNTIPIIKITSLAISASKSGGGVFHGRLHSEEKLLRTATYVDLLAFVQSHGVSEHFDVDVTRV